MRVIGPSLQLPVATAKVKKSGESDSGFTVAEETAEAQVKPNAKTVATSSLGALIAAQLHGEDDDITERRSRRKKGVKKGEDILSVLDAMKIDMLAGTLSPAKMQQLLASVNACEKNYGDEKLDDLIEQIKLRARVELAKLQSRDKGA